MSDLVLREADGWYEIELQEILDPNTLFAQADDEHEAFDAIDTNAIVNRLEERDLFDEPALVEYDSDESWDTLFDGIQVLQQFSDLKGWIFRVWVHVAEDVRAGA